MVKVANPFSYTFIKENSTDQDFIPFSKIVSGQHTPTHQFLKEQKRRDGKKQAWKEQLPSK